MTVDELVTNNMSCMDIVTAMSRPCKIGMFKGRFYGVIVKLRIATSTKLEVL